VRTFHALSPEKVLGQFSVDAAVPLERIVVDKLMSNRTGRLSRMCPAQRATRICKPMSARISRHSRRIHITGNLGWIGLDGFSKLGS
jgi:hypothetical protein